MTYNFFSLTFWNTSLFLNVISGFGNKALNVKSNTGMPAFHQKNSHILNHSFLIKYSTCPHFSHLKFKLIKLFSIRFLRTLLFHLCTCNVSFVSSMIIKAFIIIAILSFFICHSKQRHWLSFYSLSSFSVAWIYPSGPYPFLYSEYRCTKQLYDY